MARGTTLVFKNHQQNGSFRSHQILKRENTNHFCFYYCFLSLILSILFCFVSSIMGVDLYTSFSKYRCFWLEKRGSTYTRIDLYTRKYGRYRKVTKSIIETFRRALHTKIEFNIREFSNLKTLNDHKNPGHSVISLALPQGEEFEEKLWFGFKCSASPPPHHHLLTLVEF